MRRQPRGAAYAGAALRMQCAWVAQQCSLRLAIGGSGRRSYVPSDWLCDDMVPCRIAMPCLKRLQLPHAAEGLADAVLLWLQALGAQLDPHPPLPQHASLPSRRFALERQHRNGQLASGGVPDCVVCQQAPGRCSSGGVLERSKQWFRQHVTSLPAVGRPGGRPCVQLHAAPVCRGVHRQLVR